MTATYNDTMRRMKGYFAANNAYEQNPDTVHRMSKYYTGKEDEFCSANIRTCFSLLRSEG
jgi:hypothetical protein